MASHAFGRRSGDQFCVYIHDYFVIPVLVKNGCFKPTRGILNKLTKNYIQTNLNYRFLDFESDDSEVIVYKASIAPLFRKRSIIFFTISIL